jgi:hypothetical protein
METDIFLGFTLEFGDPLYSEQTMREWQNIWKIVCEMAHNPSSRQYPSIHTFGSYSNEIEDLHTYTINSRRIKNHTLLCFEHVWKEYKKKVPTINTSLKELYIPRLLIPTPEAQKFIQQIFPSCTIIFWAE